MKIVHVIYNGYCLFLLFSSFLGPFISKKYVSANGILLVYCEAARHSKQIRNYIVGNMALMFSSSQK